MVTVPGRGEIHPGVRDDGVKTCLWLQPGLEHSQPGSNLFPESITTSKLLTIRPCFGQALVLPPLNCCRTSGGFIARVQRTVRLSEAALQSETSQSNFSGIMAAIR